MTCFSTTRFENVIHRRSDSRPHAETTESVPRRPCLQKAEMLLAGVSPFFRSRFGARHRQRLAQRASARTTIGLDDARWPVGRAGVARRAGIEARPTVAKTRRAHAVRNRSSD